MHDDPDDTKNDFFRGWCEGRRTLIQKLRDMGPAEEIIDQLRKEDQKDRNVAKKLGIKVKVF